MGRLRLLLVAYPFAAVGPDAVGGAEQVLSLLDRALVERGHRSTVIACDGSRTYGELIAIRTHAGTDDAGTPNSATIDDAARERAHAALREAIGSVRARADVVHLHGIDFPAYAPDPAPPVLATLHLPPDWYPPEAFAGGWRVHCVSETQHRTCPPSSALLPPIGNGIDVAALGAIRPPRGGYALMLGRICPEKGQHLGLRAAHGAGADLLLAGAVFPYAAHRDYFARQVQPQLDGRRRWIGPVGFARKRELLAAARCLLVPSLAAETSSLVAMEAAACGTPVIAFRAGALPEIVRDGETGFLVDDVAGMAAALARAGEISPDRCRAEAAARFDMRRMVAAYLDRYADLAA